MAETPNKLSIQFTDETYATKNEVSQRLNIAYVDSIWNSILSYRMTFNSYLSDLRLVDNSPLVLCLAPGIEKKVEVVEADAIRALNKMARISSNPTEFNAYKEEAYVACLKEINNVSHLDIDEKTLKSIVRGEITRSNDEKVSQLTNYYSALRYLETYPEGNVDEDLLGDLYSRLTGNYDLVSFYREEDDQNRVLINKYYESVPHNSIEPMMDGLFNFLKNDNVSAFVKATVISFYIRYVKPFPSLSSEISVLLMKALLVTEYGGNAALIDLEMFLSSSNDNLKKMFNEVQSTRDVTYYVNAALPLLGSILTKTLDKIETFEAEVNKTQSEQLKKDFYGEVQSVEAEAEKIKEETPAETQPVIEETTTEQKEEESVIISDTQNEQVNLVVEPIVKPEVEQVKETPKVEDIPTPKPAPTPAPKQAPTPTPAPETTKESVAYAPQREQIASYLPPVLDEREAQRLEEHLLELDPTMHRKEAAFYARHCTLGKKYTIAQCKKYLGCAYETARKTMERLVELGYYRREMVKNKSVYAPIPRNEEL